MILRVVPALGEQVYRLSAGVRQSQHTRGLIEALPRRVIARLEDSETVSDEVLQQYTDPESPKYDEMIEEIRKELNFTTLRYNRLDDMLDAVGIPKENLCTYCWNGKE